MKIRWLFALLAGLCALVSAVSVTGATDRAPYLGVVTRTADPLVDTLAREDGIGLMVMGVDPESPAGAVLREGDLLYKLDDQWLVDPRQLRILVHRFQPDDEITLAFLRQGEPREARVRLGEIDASEPGWGSGPLPRPWPPVPGATPPHLHRNWQEAFESLRRQMEEMDRRMGDLSEGLPRGVPPPERMPGARREETRITSRQRVQVTKQADGTQIRLEERNGERHLKVTDAEGEVLFDGPVNTAEELEAVPDAFRGLIDETPVARPRPRLIPRDVL